MPYGFITPKNTPPQIEIGARTIFLGVDPGQTDPLSDPIPCGANPGWEVVNAMRRGLNNDHLRSLELNQTGNPVDVLDSSRVTNIVDVAGRVEKLKRLSHSVSECDPSISDDLRNFSHQVRPLQKDMDGSGEELKRTVKDLVGKHRNLRGFSPYGRPVEVLERVDVLIDLGHSLDMNTPHAALSQKINDRLQIFTNGVARDAGMLRNAMLDRGETLAALSAFQTHVGDLESNSYVILTRDINEALAERGEALANSIANIRGLPFIDVVFCNPFYGDVAELHAFAELLRLRKRSAIWATLGEIGTEQQAVKFAGANPKLGTFGAASLCLYAGSAIHRGFPVPTSAMVAGLRIHCDQIGPSAMLEPVWGPQASKNLIADAAKNSDGFETTAWSDQTHKLLAMEAGVNAVRRHDTQVRSPMFGRAPCNLRGYQFNDSNRLGALLAGNAVAWYEQVVPSTVNTPEVQRVWCQEAERIFFGPFKNQSGFHGDIRPQSSSKLGTLNVSMRVQMADPVESIIAQYEQI